MTQRGFVIPVMLIVYGLAALAMLATVGIAKHKIESWCNHACVDARSERDKLLAEKREALRREAAIATLYGAQVAATQAAETKRSEARHDTFVPIRTRAAAVGNDCRVSADAVRLLGDATRAANAAGPPAGTESAAPTAAAPADSASLVQWFVDVAEIHAECRDRVAAWERFYDGLRTDK